MKINYSESLKVNNKEEIKMGWKYTDFYTGFFPKPNIKEFIYFITLKKSFKSP